VPEFVDDDVEPRLEVDERLVGPDAFTQRLPRNQLPGSRHEHPEHLTRLLLQPDVVPSGLELSGLEIELEDAKSNDAPGWHGGLPKCVG
jgi:hypothetical protein